MVKLAVKLPVFIFCIVILYASTLAEETDEKWCIKQQSFIGKCGMKNGPEECIHDFIKEYGKSIKPRNCICQTVSRNHDRRYYLYRRFCTCQTVCNP
ncbi:hypothetical protein M5689_007965 [Euphorbia peplus]|nr:hypothetical protein M5689_007965 [Euphorbia peplus]